MGTSQSHIVKNTIIPITSIACLLLPGCGRISITNNWKPIHANVLTRTGYEVAFNLTEKEENHIPELFTKQDAVEHALKSNPRLHAQFQELGIAKSDLVQSGLYKNPYFSSAINIPKDKKNTSEVELGFSISLADAWQLPVRKQVASYYLEVVSLMIINTILTIIAETEHAYLTCNYLQEIANLHEQLYQESILLVNQLQYRQQFGMQSDWDIYQAQAITNQYYADLLDSLNELTISHSTLRQIMGQHPSLEPILIANTLLNTQPALSYDLLYSAAMQRPDILAAEYKIMQFEQIIKLEHLRFIDTFNIGVSYTKDFDRSKGTGPLLSLELPIFDQNQAQIACAQFGQRQAEHELHTKQLEVTHRLNREYSSYKTAQQKLIPLVNAVENQKKSVEYTYRYFKTKQIQLPILIQTRLDLLQNELKLLQARYELNSAYITIQQIVGKKLDTLGDDNLV